MKSRAHREEIELEVGDGRLHIERRGDGPAILLLHGWPLDHRMFAPQLDDLADEWSLIAPDRRGFGRSTAPPDLARELDDIDRVLDHFAADRAHLLGMSQGARIALRYAAVRGARLRSLILQGAVVDGLVVEEPEKERIPLADYARLVRNGHVDEVRRRWLEHPMMDLGPGHEETARRLRSMLEAWEGADLWPPAPTTPVANDDLPAALARFEAPTLILTGRRETRARKAHAAALLEILPNAKERILEHSGHLSNLTEPAVYNAAVRAFCRASDASAA